MNKRKPSLLLSLVLIALSGGQPAASTCQCSCASFAEFESRVIAFEGELDAGLSAALTPALQTQLACLEPCAEQWMQCPTGNSSAPIQAEEEFQALQVSKSSGQNPD